MMTALLLCLLCGLILFCLYAFGFLQLNLAIPALLLSCVGVLWMRSTLLPTINQALSLSHQQNPNLEYSGELLLSDAQLDGLALIQKSKVASEFAATNYQFPVDWPFIKRGLLLIVGMSIGGIALQALMFENLDIRPDTKVVESAPVLISSEIELLDSIKINGLNISIKPPSYTALPVRYAKDPNLIIPEGSKVSWKLDVTGKVIEQYFDFGDADSVGVNAGGTVSRTFVKSDFYKYGVVGESDEFVSEYYSIKVVPDERPVIDIKGIEEYVSLPWAKNHVIPFNIDVSDDYGIKDTYISATIAKGSGEAVKFREKRFDLKTLQTGSKDFSSSFSFETEDLDMGPGDELFFYVYAEDNYPYESHWSKSKTFFVTIQDTTTYEYSDDAGMQMDVMPDFFRSQRQIIIDTEKLLASKNSISIDSFKNASNALGFDQKMLRLKYGQFLGEENESGITFDNEFEAEEDHDHEGHDHDDHEAEHGGASNALQGARDLLTQFMHDHDHEEEEGLLMATKGTEKKPDATRPTWVEELSHNHDDGEVATFHNISAKSKLKAALSVMWDAELHLRLYDPQTSLPFQKESLELLQEIKNHARIYVHRIGFDPPALKEVELRLTGDLDEITSPSYTLNNDHKDPFGEIKRAIELLGGRSNEYAEVLENISAALASIAIDRPQVLPLLSLTQQLSNSTNGYSRSDIASLREGLILLLPDDAIAIPDNYKYAHEVTRSVTKKITF